MKKMICVILAALLLGSVAGVAVFAEDVAAPAVVYRGDVDGNGRVNATDARIILRVAAKMDTLDENFSLIADIDEDGKIRASDARIALRMAAKLDSLFTMDEKYHAHDFLIKDVVAVTCTQDGLRKYCCKICGFVKEEKVFAGHEYAAATCTAPETCVRCGATRGAALGHTTRLGCCGNCGEVIDLLLPQSDGLIDLLNQYIAAYQKMGELMQYEDARGVRASLNSQRSLLNQMIAACEGYPEFDMVKEHCYALLNLTDQMINLGMPTDWNYETWLVCINSWSYEMGSLNADIESAWGYFYTFE